jgi:hypothetical protein
MAEHQMFIGMRFALSNKAPRLLELLLMRSILLAVSILFASTRANADVIYNWVPNDPAVASTGQIVFADEALTTGVSSFSHNAPLGLPAPPSINGNVFSFMFRFHLGTLTINFSAPGATTGWLEFDVLLSAEGLTGSIYANDGEANVRMFGGTTLWTISEFANDSDRANGASNACYFTPNNCQTTGRWQLAHAPPPASVPEPFSGVLLGIGLAAIALRRRLLASANRAMR